MSLHTAAASAAIMRLSARSTFTSIPGEISARGGYVAGGRNLVPATGRWVVGTSARAYQFGFDPLVFTASGSALNNIKYALIRNSVAAGSGRILCFATLSGSPFTIASPNTVMILADRNGSGAVFTLDDTARSSQDITPLTGALVLSGSASH